VRQGEVFDLGRILDSTVRHFPGRFWQQTLVSNAHLSSPRRHEGTDGGWGKNQVNWLIELATSTFQIVTDLDGLNHLQIGDRSREARVALDIVLSCMGSVRGGLDADQFRPTDTPKWPGNWKSPPAN
jgi:hypothetical protein